MKFCRLRCRWEPAGPADPPRPVTTPSSGVRNQEDRAFGSLTRREREVLGGLVAGLRPADIALRDFVSVVTVRNQVQAVLTKLNVHSQLEAVALARWSGWQFAAPAAAAPLAPAAFDASAS